ncbi:MAG TPA: hypothetical protein VLA14_06580 [Polyangia bacterium]|jgi:hypothetical protein|nr:hypothetical protein [Polyangia bacterium]
MKLKALAVAGLAIVGCAGAGCGGGRSRTPGAAADAGADADADASGTSAPDADAGADADAAPKPPPVTAAGSRLIVPGAAALVGHGLDSCTNALPATGDTWCAFGRPAGATGFFELWALDATKAAAGAAITCDGAHASCLRVSAHLFKSRTNGFTDAGFNGDTLIYGEALYTGESTSAFTGVIYAWRPGWTAGRALTAANGISCVGQARSDAALCFEDPNGDGMVTDLTVDLHAGLLASSTGPTLPKVDTLLLAATTDPAGAPPRYQFDFSVDGAYVAWSTRGAADDVETLHAQALGEGGGAPLVVARDVSQWQTSPDGAAWYWLAAYNYDVTGAPAGTLQAAPFPGGANPTTLATGVGDFSAVGAASLWLRTEVATQVGTLRWMADRAAPAAISTVDAKVLAVLDASRDGTLLLYAKTFVPLRPGPVTTVSVAANLVDLYVGGAAGPAACVPTETPSALHAALAPAGDLVVWERADNATTNTQGMATALSSCATATFATGLLSILPAGDAGYLYLDDADDAADEATLRYARIVNASLVAGPPLQTRAAPVFAPLPAATPAVIYTVATGTAADGLYVDGALEPAAPANGDAGADAATGDAPGGDAISDAGAAE